MSARCDDCGRFFSAALGYAWMLVYSGVPPTPDREIFRCSNCIEKAGPYLPQSGIKPEYSCGIEEPTTHARREEG